MLRSSQLISCPLLNGGSGFSLYLIHFTRPLSDPEEWTTLQSAPRKPKVFLQMDVCQPLPFEHESFDVVHARFVLMHVR